MAKLKSIAVFCGSSEGFHPIYGQIAQRLGACLAENNITLVYGGAKVGLMGRVAEGALEADGAVVGIIPEDLVLKEICHDGITELRVVSTMHQRKQAVADLAEAFILLPGGAGSLEEFFEIWSWAQLGLHMKPIGILNVNSYYDDLISLGKKMVAEKFVKSEYWSLLQIDDSPEKLLGKLFSAKIDYVSTKWMSLDSNQDRSRK